MEESTLNNSALKDLNITKNTVSTYMYVSEYRDQYDVILSGRLYKFHNRNARTVQDRVRTRLLLVEKLLQKYTVNR